MTSGGVSGTEAGGSLGFEGPLPCVSDGAIYAGGVELCDDGDQHRAMAEACPRPQACGASPCNVGCTNDEDCAADERCLCDAVMNNCVEARCRSDADCATGFLCITDAQGTFACQTADDECTTRCPEGKGSCLLEERDDGTYRRACVVTMGAGGSGPNP